MAAEACAAWALAATLTARSFWSATLMSSWHWKGIPPKAPSYTSAAI